MSEFDLDSFRYKEKETAELDYPDLGTGLDEKRFFVKGPIFLSWIGKAARLPGRTLHVALALHFLSGLQKSKVIKMQKKVREAFGISDEVYCRSLTRLESEGLIAVSRLPGQTPIVKLIAP